MTLSRRGFRRLDVDGTPHFWRVIDAGEPVFPSGDPGLRVDVVTETAFVHGQRGQRLIFPVRFSRMADGTWRSPPITPRLIRWVINAARPGSRGFTGDDGAADVTLAYPELFDVAEAEFMKLHDAAGAVVGDDTRELWMVGEAVVALEIFAENLVDAPVPVEPELLAAVEALATLLGVEGALHAVRCARTNSRAP